MMSVFLSELRHAARSLAKQPGFTSVAALTLALGIGANTAIFSVIHAVLLAPLPYPDADRIVTLHETNGTGTPFAIAFPDYLDWRRDNKSFEHLALTRRDSRNLSGILGREPERVGAAFVTANFFYVIGLAPTIGRAFTEEEDRVGGPALAVISDRLWQRAFNRDAGVLGRAVTFHNQSFTVVGVMPPEMSSPQETDVWFPIMRRSNNPAWMARENHPLTYGWGRLKPGVTVEAARAEMKAIAARLEKDFPATNADVTAEVVPLLENLVGAYRRNLVFLLGAVGLVLLIACANLANLVAARGVAREREFAIRAAIGGTRAQIMRQLLAECLLIAALGGVLGFLFAVWGRDTLLALAPQGAARFQNVAFNAPVLAFTFAVTSLTTVLFGLWPARRASHADVQLALKSGSHGSSDTRAARRTRDSLVIGEIALTLILLTAAGLVLKSFANAASLSLGYEPRGLLTARIDLPSSIYPNVEKIGNFTRALLEKVRALPGVESAAISANPPLLSGWQIAFSREGVEATPAQQPSAESEVITPDYFATFKVPLMRGRTFTERDDKDTPLAVIIDQNFAEQFFPGEDPIGKRIMTDPENEEGGTRAFEIVGVAARMKFYGFDDPRPSAVMFFSHAQVERQNLVLHVRSAGNLASLERPIRQIVTAIDPAQPVFEVRPMLDRVAETWATQKLLTFLLLAFAGLALVLASVGLYGALTFTAVRRFREVGIRLALGARPAQIRQLVLGHGMRLLLIGGAIGTAGAVIAARLLRAMLFGVEATDPGVYLAVGSVLLFATLLACWLPARRASRVDPMVALRNE